MTLEPGITLGRYQILAPLGHGGMASVYKAFQPALERVVALKVLRPAYASDPEFLERFRREAKAIARLRHPHIVQVHDFEEAAGQVYLVMEHIEGGTLKQRLSQLGREGQRLPPRELGRIVREVAEALGHAHAQGIVHRDIKPSNVMITRDGKAVVTDFGIAKILAAAGATQTGVGVGTPEYMSPEQGQASSAVDHRSDIYSLGVVAYELLTGRVPFSADTPLAVMLAHVRDPLPLPSKLDPRIGPRTEQVLLRALAKDPAARYGAATELAAALDEALAQEAEHGEVPPTVARATPRVRAAALPALPRTLTLPVPSRSFLVGLGGGVLALAVLGGGAAVLGVFGTDPTAALTAPTAAASAAPTPLPTWPPSVTRGPLVYEMKLDSAGSDLKLANTFINPDRDAADLRMTDGALELLIRRPRSEVAVHLKYPPPARYAAEMIVSLRLSSRALDFAWEVAQAEKISYVVHIDSDGESVFVMKYDATMGIPPKSERITPTIPLRGILTGRHFILAVRVDVRNLVLIVDGKPVAESRDDSLQPGVHPMVIHLFGPGETSDGAATIHALRVYALP